MRNPLCRLGTSPDVHGFIRRVPVIMGSASRRRIMRMQITTLTHKTREKAGESLSGVRSGIRGFLPFLGPAIIASIAYMDPGNFATNIQSGASFGYMLLWVVLLANLIAMLFQSLSAKLGIVTGMSLASVCRENLPRPLVAVMWIGSELSAIATDLAEVLGGALGLSLLFHIPLLPACVIVGIATYLILLLHGYGFRPMEIVISAFVSIISLSYVAELFIAPPRWGEALYHTFVPQLAGGESVLLAVGIVGATVMPHALYLHSDLTKDRIPTKNESEKRRVIRYSNHEVLLALGLAGLVNMAMVAISASAFYFTGHQGVSDIASAYQTLAPLFGEASAAIFLLSLLASGFSSSVVGTMAGQTIMQDFVRFRIPLWFRRIVTLAPACVIAALGVNVIHALVMSQVVLSLALPIPMIALVYLTSKRSVMGAFTSSKLVVVASVAASVVVLALNGYLLAQYL